MAPPWRCDASPPPDTETRFAGHGSPTERGLIFASGPNLKPQVGHFREVPCRAKPASVSGWAGKPEGLARSLLSGRELARGNGKGLCANRRQAIPGLAGFRGAARSAQPCTNLRGLRGLRVRQSAPHGPLWSSCPLCRLRVKPNPAPRRSSAPCTLYTFYTAEMSLPLRASALKSRREETQRAAPDGAAPALHSPDRYCASARTFTRKKRKAETSTPAGASSALTTASPPTRFVRTVRTVVHSASARSALPWTS